MSAFTYAIAHWALVEKISAITWDFWAKIVVLIIVSVMTAMLMRKLANFSKIALGFGIFFLLSNVGTTWIRERNEPSWASPVVNALAIFFPSKGGSSPKQ